MPRIEDSQVFEEVASSLLSDAEQAAEHDAPEQEPSEFASPGSALVDEFINAEANDPIKYGDAAIEARQQERPEAEQQAQPNREQIQERTQPEGQQAELTPQQIEEGIEHLASDVEQFALNEPQAASEFASDFFGAFNTSAHDAGGNVEALGGAVAKTVLSGLQLYSSYKGDLSQLPPIPPQAAQSFTHEICRGIGLDPRTPGIDAGLLASTTLGAILNFLNTYDSYGGRVTDLARLNDPQAAEFYLANFAKALGHDGPVNREAAVRLADALGKQALRIIGKMSEVERQANQPRQPRGRGQRVSAAYREGVRGSKVPKMTTNQDIFDEASIRAASRQRL